MTLTSSQSFMCIVPYHSFSLICFQNSSSLIHPLFLPAGGPCPWLVLQMSSPVCCLHFQSHTDCISLNQFYQFLNSIDGSGFQGNAYHSFLGFCQVGFQVPVAQLEAHSKSTAEQTVHRLAQQREVFVLGFLTMSVSASWKGWRLSRGYVLAPLKSLWSQCFVTEIGTVLKSLEGW